MTKTDIIQAAFQVWGADFYLKTSLTEIAHALNVTKPALYRHFSNKEELLNAMYENFFDVLAGFLSPFFDKSYKEDANEGLITIALGFAEFFLRNNEYFVFFLIYILENGDKEHNVFSKIALRGLNIEKLMAADNGGNRPSKLMFVMRNIGFMTARYNKKFFKVKKKPEETEINEFIQTAAFYIRRGLGFNKQIIDALDWDHIEQSVLSIGAGPPPKTRTEGGEE
ncbi:MAG: TetR/AcrR family transcriptional regulator, partial [Spirochaetaceae bacterium]|nr:TetR/AcrR family transcriptional regulator [Spirochaetaceae bacterium]